MNSLRACLLDGASPRVLTHVSVSWTIDDDLRIRVAQSEIAESILPGGSHFKVADLHGRRFSFAA